MFEGFKSKYVKIKKGKVFCKNLENRVLVSGKAKTQKISVLNI